MDKKGTDIRWPHLNDSLRDFALAAIKKIECLYKDRDSYPTSSRWEWIEGSGGLTYGAFVDVKDHEIAVWECEKELESLLEYKALLEAIQKDGLAPDFSGYEVTCYSILPLKAKTIIHAFLEEMLSRYEVSQDALSSFREFYPQFEDALTRTEIEITVVAHLQGFYSEIEELEFDNAAKLRRLSLQEMNKLYGHESFYPHSKYTNYRYVLISTCKTERTLLPDRPTKNNFKAPEDAVIERMHEIVKLFRIFKPGHIEIDNTISYPSNWEIERHRRSWVHSSDIFISDPFSLNQSDIKPFKEFYCNYVSMSSEKNKKFANALRWLSQASIRKLKDDRFLDYVIALESLYVEGNEEVSYRISMRSAHFLGANKHERNRIFHLMRTAYKIRSVMVHDGKSLPKEVKIESVGTMSGDAFLNEIGVICFTTLKKIVNSKGNDFPTTSKAWDELILLGRT